MIKYVSKLFIFIKYVDNQVNTYTHSPMINKNSVRILNQKFKREHMMKMKKNDSRTKLNANI